MGGVYKGQGLNQRELMSRAYWEFLVRGTLSQATVPITDGAQQFTRACWRRAKVHAGPSSVARMRPRTSKGITDLLLLHLAQLAAARPSKITKANE